MTTGPEAAAPPRGAAGAVLVVPAVALNCWANAAMLWAAAKAALSRCSTLSGVLGGCAGGTAGGGTGGVGGTELVRSSAQSGIPDCELADTWIVDCVVTGVATGLVGTHVPHEFAVPTGLQLVALGRRDPAQGSLAWKGSVPALVM